MGNKEDWEELEKWQKEQEMKESSKEKIYAKKFTDKDMKKAKIFSRIFSSMFKTISATAILIGFIAIVCAILFVNYLFGLKAPQNIEKYLSDIYQGQKFEIIEDSSDSIGRGAYVLSPKNNKNIKFKAYNYSSGTKEDYSQQRLKYYIENCEYKSLLEDFEIQEETEVFKNIEFLTHYNINTYINNYNELEEKVEKVYKLVKYLKSKDEKMYEIINIINWKDGYYFSIQCNTVSSLEQEIYKSKYEYIRVLKEKNNQEELNKIDQKEISEIWRPRFLNLIINDKQIKLYNNVNAIVYYDLENRKYCMSGTEVILQQIEQIEILKTSKFTGKVKKIKYNNKEYKIEESSSNGKNKKNVIYAGDGLEKFLEKFNSEIKYDYDNGKVYVTIK